MSAPISIRRRLTASSSSALASAAFTFAITGFGVPAGANSAFQAENWKSGKPASAVVGTSGTAALRAGEATAKALMPPAFTCGALLRT